MSKSVVWGVAAVLALVLLGLLGWWWWQRDHVPMPRLQVPVTADSGGPAVPDGPSTPPAEPAAPGVQYPIEQALTDPSDPSAAERPPLPALDDSDRGLSEALSARQDRAVWETLLISEGLVRRIVATVDNLPREQVAAQVMPMQPVPGALKVDESGYNVRIAPDNAARYATHVRAFEALDTQALVGVYVRWYPLFQQAYQDLGYPQGYFNDRLVQVIDHLLATPTVTEPLAVVQPKVLWQFADPSLEALSAGQKMLLRMGPEHAARVKAKLLSIRQAVVGQRTTLTPGR